MKQIFKFAAATALLALAAAAHAQAAPKVIASIKPLHSLVASVMGSTGEPGLIVGKGASPHTYSLKPSDAEAIQQADLVFWIGPDMEGFLTKPIESIGSKAKAVELDKTPGIKLLPVRTDPNFEPDDDGDELASHDPHFWLDPENAVKMVGFIAKALAEADPANAKTYEANAAATVKRLKDEEAKLRAELAPVQGKPFIVFHDAYHYFEKRFGVHATGAFTIHPENPPGAARLEDLHKKIVDGKAVCVFAEPQFDNQLINAVVEGTNAKSGVLDPEGALLDPGPDLYFNLLNQIEKALTGCLK